MGGGRIGMIPTNRQLLMGMLVLSAISAMVLCVLALREHRATDRVTELGAALEALQGEQLERAQEERTRLQARIDELELRLARLEPLDSLIRGAAGALEAQTASLAELERLLKEFREVMTRPLDEVGDTEQGMGDGPCRSRSACAPVVLGPPVPPIEVDIPAHGEEAPASEAALEVDGADSGTKTEVLSEDGS